jgi:hypothetical protein
MKLKAVVLLSVIFILSVIVHFRSGNTNFQVSNQVSAQSNNSNIESETVPPNPFLMRSPWAGFHRNNYAQASTPFRGLEPNDNVEVQFRETPVGNTSSWSILSEKYPNGERVVWGNTSTHVFKALVKDGDFEIVADKRMSFDRFGFNWNTVVFRNGEVVVPDRKKRRYYKFVETDKNDPRSPIRLAATWNIPEEIPGLSAQFNVSYDGRLIILTDKNYLVALKSDFSSYEYFQMNFIKGDSGAHNAFPIDENGNMFFVSTKAMTSVRWDGSRFSINWQVPYNFRGPGCPENERGTFIEVWNVLRGARCTGSGTTPTLMGTGSDSDKLVLVVDGHAPKNNMVAFWRGEIPNNWQAISGYDRRVAAVTPLPFSTPDGKGFTAENSPTAWGYEIATAQWNGFEPDCDPLNGVQKLRWSPQTRKLDVVWANNQVQMNGVLTYSKGSNLVYSSGRRNCTYYYWGLDWQTGEVKVEIPMGGDDRFLDQGNQSTVNDDRSIIFGSAKGIVRLRPQ